MKKRTFFILFLIIMAITACQQKRDMIEDLMKKSGKFNTVLENAEKHKLQIIYTQIDRDKNNNATFKTYTYRVNNKEYFYPASSIKLPVAALAIEKINDQHIKDLHLSTKMEIDSAYSGQSKVLTDTSSENGTPSIGNYIKKLFLVSDNDAYNRLYEFLGQEDANRMLIEKGYDDIRITHRLSLPLSRDENRHTNPMSFYSGSKLVYHQGPLVNEIEIKSDPPVTVGSGYIRDEVLVNEPMDFTYKNAISMASLHSVLLKILFPENFLLDQRFHLKKQDHQFLYKAMSTYPRESDFPHYGTRFTDDYCKFLMFAGTERQIDDNIRIFNKIGQAYGFLVDMAYIIDFEKRIEFILGAVIYVNENNVLNDDNYEYETIGYPFMKDLGELFYHYEINRHRLHRPDLSKYNWKSWEE